ncbi:hypothetical protein D3C72_2045010 [compost metagenome]
MKYRGVGLAQWPHGLAAPHQPVQPDRPLVHLAEQHCDHERLLHRQLQTVTDVGRTGGSAEQNKQQRR